MWTILKSLLNLLKCCFCFILCLLFVFPPHGVWDLSSPTMTKPATHVSEIKVPTCEHQGSAHNFFFFIDLLVYSVFGHAHSLSLLAGVWSALEPQCPGCRARALECWLGTYRSGLAALWQTGSLWRSNQAHVPCFNGQIPNQGTTREAPQFLIH